MLQFFQTDLVCSQQFQISWKWQEFSKQVENTMGKGEIACNGQFLLFSHCVFKRLVLQTLEN